MSALPDLHPTRLFPGDPGPLAHRPELLQEPRFWRQHLSACLREAIPSSWLGTHDPLADRTFARRLWAGNDQPVFTVPLTDGLRLHVVYRNAAEDPGVDYAVHHPDWAEAEVLARDAGHWRGPGLSWEELAGAADNGLPGGTTTDPDTRLLLLLPALGDTIPPSAAGKRLAACLRDRLAVAEPGRLAAAVLRRQGMADPSRWSTDDHGVRTDDGTYSFRNPANRDALPDCRMAQISAALTPRPDPHHRHAARQPDDRPGGCRPDGCQATPRSTADCPRRAAYTAWLADLSANPAPPF
ncbi:hypothetical protein AB0F18_33820 [Streptomyces sp. NPDC029216]|uniref:hypothetical protein n=1 Tax=Streptomyces sp. NPDC029216 TaxID=3154701 RepID=UPI0033EDBED0